MVGRYKDFVSRIREKQRGIIVTHCFLHREMLVVKTLPANLAWTLNTVVSIVNFVKTKPLKVACLQFHVKKWVQITQICCFIPKSVGYHKVKS